MRRVREGKLKGGMNKALSLSLPRLGSRTISYKAMAL